MVMPVTSRHEEALVDPELECAEVDLRADLQKGCWPRTLCMKRRVILICS